MCERPLFGRQQSFRLNVEWDELSYEERQGETARMELVRYKYQELDYRLRAKLLQVFGEL